MGTGSPPPKGASPESARGAAFLNEVEDEIEFDIAFEEEPTLPQDGAPTPESKARAGATGGEAGPNPPAGMPSISAPAVTKAPLELDLPGDDARLVVELMSDGRLRAPIQAAREILRDRLRRAEVLRTGPAWAVLRSLDRGPKEVRGKIIGTDREVVVAGVIGEGGLSLIDFIGFLATGMQTGVLTVASGDFERSVYFFNGDVVWATSNAPQDRLGEFLLQRGKITREQLQVAIRDGEKKFGRACVERGFIAAHELYAMVQAQLTETFDKLLGTESGVWFFSRISGSALAESQIHLSTQGLLVDALRRLDELQVYRQRIRSSDVRVQRVPRSRGAGPASVGASTGDILEEVEGGIRDGAAQLLKQLPGTATISELMRILGKGEFDVTRAVYHLLRRNLVEIVQQEETGPIPRRVASISKTEVREVIGIYSMAIREMFEEVGRVNNADALLIAAQAFLRDESTPYAHFLRAATLGPDGSIDENALLGALQGIAFTSQELSDALSELLFFVLFQATEFLGRRRGDDLARRVKLILGMLAHAGVTTAPSGTVD